MRFVRRGVAILCIAVLMASGRMPMEIEASDTPIPQIRLTVGGGQSTPTYRAGQKVKLQINIQNQGQAQAENVVIAPVLDDASVWPFEITSMNYEQSLGEIKSGETVSAAWDFQVRSDVDSKSYRLDFILTYDDGEELYQDNKYVYVKTTAKTTSGSPESQMKEETRNESGIEAYGMETGAISNSDPVAVGGSTENTSVPRVIVIGFSTKPGEVKAGSNFELTVHVKNTATWTGVSNMLFDFQAPASGTEDAAEAPAFLPSSGSSSIYLESIPAGETRDISIELNARADLVQKPYSIAMSIKYEDGSAAQYEGTSSLAIPVKQAARFEFSEIELAPESIAVGEEANITCSLYNTGRTKLYNVKAKFQGEGIEGKEVFVGNIESGATGVIDGMITGSQEMGRGAKCKMIVTYEDEAGKRSAVEKEFNVEVTPAAAETDMSTVNGGEEEQGFPVLPLMLGALFIILAVIAVIIVITVRKKKKTTIEEEDLLDEVERFAEDERHEP